MLRLIGRLDSPKLVVALTALAYYLFIVARLSRHGYDVSYFVTAGDRFSDPRLVPRSLSVIPNSDGYDGQFYYRLTLDPFTAQRQAFGITLDQPAVRQSRIGYPLLVWALSLGRAPLVAALMLVVNAAALCVIGWLGALYARSQGRHALWALAFPLSAGLLLSMSRDLTETLATCLLFAAVLLLQQKRAWLATFVLCVAALTRETILLYAGVTLLVVLWRRWKGLGSDGLRAYVFAAPLALYAVWLVWMSFRWGRFAQDTHLRNFGWPLAGLAAFISAITPPATHEQWTWWVELCFLALFTLAVLCALRNSRPLLTFEFAAWLAYAAAALCWSTYLWSEDWAFMRGFPEFFLFGTMGLLSKPSRLGQMVVAASLALWLLLARDVALYH